MNYDDYEVSMFCKTKCSCRWSNFDWEEEYCHLNKDIGHCPLIDFDYMLRTRGKE